MRAVARALDQFPPVEQRFDFLRCERIAGLDRGFARHHIQHFVKQFLFVKVKQFLFAAFQ